MEPFKKYLQRTAAKEDTSRGAANLLATFREMKAAGAPISIRRVKLKPKPKPKPG